MPGIVRALQPPVGGWDTRNALADMPGENAVKLDNWFPSTDRVTVRRGHVSHATGMPGAVDTLMTYVPPSGVSQFYAASGAGIYNVTSAGAVGAAVVTGRTSAQFQHVQIGTTGGNFLFCCNGVDTPQIYDGATWANTGITGPTVANLRWCNVHQNRLWVGEAASLRAWYLPVNAITGAATSFNFSGLARRGGYLVGMGTWSRDGGAGGNDTAVFLTSEGEAIVYQGTDPASISTWGLVGVFRIGRPVGLRPFVKSSADLIIITQDGFLPVSTVLPVDRAQAEVAAVSVQINNAVTEAARDYSASFGWEGMLYPSGQMLIFNVPQTTGTVHQYVFNTITRAPCRFIGMNARCWGLLNDQPYFGGSDGAVYRFDTGASDNGTNISADALQAFNYFGSPSVVKAFKRVEIVLQSTQLPGIAADMALDFDTTAPTPAFSPVVMPTAGVFGTGLFGAAVFGGAAVFQGWRGVRGVARAAAVRVRTVGSAASPAWSATNVLFVPGGRV